ncbi:TIGR04255 family protein [Flagellimonas olearia]|uniref:TIGR04255 family protein n=1 Tax=Flagellimonas olearia TaxID=552546 RepID=A0A444VI44_9FLAO|nr:TIGR04255 family protein [Allomuricauda olearia]RYC50437.1 hypothetical protein DN53_05840 [Allomuricauda olearia]
MASNLSYEYFDNAPIIISMIQFRYDKIEDLNFEQIIKDSKKLSNNFPNRKPQITRDIQIQGLETSIKVGDAETSGVLLSSSNEKKNLTINDKKFTLESREKYTGWDSFIKEAMELWDFFKEKLEVTKLSGISVRTINRFNLPMDLKSINDYFTSYIQSDTGTHKFSTFQFKYTSFDKDNSMLWNIGQALEKPISDKVPYFFDIDVLMNKEIPNTNEDILNGFTKIRDKKNYLFNDGITEKTKQLIR